jgi:hypothetical protein
MTLEEVRTRLASGTEGLWWSFRFLELVLDDFKTASEQDKSAAIDCFVRLAAEDPAWATSKLSDCGPEAHRIAMLLAEERLTSALGRIRLPLIKDDAMLRAHMLIGSARWQPRERGAGDDRLWRQAWQELLRVSEEERDNAWTCAALGPTAIVEYARYRELAEEHLMTLRHDFDRSMFLPDAIGTAARHHDWPTFEAWARAYRELPQPFRSDHAECTVINLEGLRALDEGRRQEAEASMRELLALAPALTFLSNDDVSALPERLRSEGLCADLCDAFDSLVNQRDWRLLTPVGPSEPG